MKPERCSLRRRAGSLEFLFLMGSKTHRPVSTYRELLVSASLKARRSELNRKINAYLQECRAVETPPRVGELANHLGMPRWKLTRTIRRAFGYTLQEHLQRARIRCTRGYLRHSNLPMNRIAYLCGFGTRATFYKEFRRRTGMAPGQYRRRTK